MEYVSSNMGLVLKAFLDATQASLYDEIHYVYDENLDYESALRNFRRNYSKEPFLPAFIFKRSVLKHQEMGISKRASKLKVTDPMVSDGVTPLYKIVQGRLDIPFLYVDERMERIEKFEILYLSERGMAKNKEIQVTIPDVNVFPYYVQYEDLEDKIVEHSENYYKGVSGNVIIRGSFLVFDDQYHPIIKEIKETIQTFYNEVFITKTITP